MPLYKVLWGGNSTPVDDGQFLNIHGSTCSFGSYQFPLIIFRYCICEFQQLFLPGTYYPGPANANFNLKK